MHYWRNITQLKKMLKLRTREIYERDINLIKKISDIIEERK